MFIAIVTFVSNFRLFSLFFGLLCLSLSLVMDKLANVMVPPMLVLTGMKESRGVWPSILLGCFGIVKLLLLCASLLLLPPLPIGTSLMAVGIVLAARCAKVFVGGCSTILGRWLSGLLFFVFYLSFSCFSRYFITSQRSPQSPMTPFPMLAWTVA